MWFAIKAHSCRDGARHLHQMLVKSRYLSPKHKEIVDPVIHRVLRSPENLFLAMMTDYRPHIRELGRAACTSQWTNTEVQGTEVTPTFIFPKFTCHTQAVERHVKLVTEAATAV